MTVHDAPPRQLEAGKRLAYRSALVPVFLDDVNGEAMKRAAKLLGPGASIECVFIVVVPPRLPLDTPLAPEDEERVRCVLEAARIAGRRNGLRVRARVLAARSPGIAITEEATRIGADLIYLAQAHMPRSEHGLGPIARELLRRRPCRIVVETDPAGAARTEVAHGALADDAITVARAAPGNRQGHRRTAGMAALTLGALGIVFGDIGTSPLYAIQAVFNADGGAVQPIAPEVYGVLSLVFWALTLVVSVKFVTFIMRADNAGEGGVLALVGLVRRITACRPGTKALFVGLGLAGVALFYGDGMLTPAISVLSAVEGVKVAAPSLGAIVLPLVLGVLTGLFAIQRHGTHVIGRLFGPVMIVWFGALAAAGVAQLVHDPSILRAISPTYAVEFFARHPGVAFISLGSVVLVFTGAEALYADMGHFGRHPIARAWFLVAFPSLMLNYMGQGSLILEHPGAISNPFYLLVPEWAQVPMIVLATIATLIASQAVISGAFSVTRQAIQLGYLPRLTVRHTSDETIGQVYLPAVNWALFAAVIALVIGFGSSAKLATAYGIAVTGTLLVDSLLFLAVVRWLWHKPRWMVVAGVLAFVTVDVLFLTANITKILHGGWFPLVVGALVLVVMTTWDRGRRDVTAGRREAEGPVGDFIEAMEHRVPAVNRLPGVGVYLNPSPDTTPLALRVGVDRIYGIPEKVVIVTVETADAPFVAEEDRIVTHGLGGRADRYSQVTLRFGYLEDPAVPATLVRAIRAGRLPFEFNAYHATYFLSQIAIAPDRDRGMAWWRKRLFVALARNASSPTDYFRLPPERVVMLGSRVRL
jgi:KUP system potassium uptake protein